LGRGKGDDIHIAPWFCFINGTKPDYPEQILNAQWQEVATRLERMAHDNTDPESWDVHHWQELNPVHTEALVQLTCGGPQIIYHGGLLHVRLRYFDAASRRPGLPPDVGALVSSLDAESTTVTLSNISPLHERRLIVQAGAFGEHQFTQATHLDQETTPFAINGQHLHITLPPGHSLTLKLGMRRYVNQPSYQQPHM
jgi:hypothetical protein